MTHVLILPGNGGSRTRFEPLLGILADAHPHLQPVIPALRGFDGRPLPPSTDYWTDFLVDIEACLPPEEEGADWVFYGHGIGGSLLMELAARGYRLPSGRVLTPRRLILHSVIGASLHQRFFPKLMRPPWVRGLIQRLIVARWMQPIWERRLFRQPAQIPAALRRQFFADYARCAAFPVFFDLITVAWYRRVQATWPVAPPYLLWGGQERVVQARYLTLWQADFPQATIETVPDWDHFPMLDNPADFARKFVTLVSP